MNCAVLKLLQDAVKGGCPLPNSRGSQGIAGLLPAAGAVRPIWAGNSQPRKTAFLA